MRAALAHNRACLVIILLAYLAFISLGMPDGLLEVIPAFLVVLTVMLLGLYGVAVRWEGKNDQQPQDLQISAVTDNDF